MVRRVIRLCSPRWRREFSEKYRVLTFDQRGSGLSAKPDVPYSIAMLADDTAALMDHLGISAAHVIGVSMGGTIAQELALRHPKKIVSLVLGCTTAGGPNAVRAGGGAAASAYSTNAMTAEERGKALAEAAFTKGYLAQHPEVITSMIESRRQRPIDSAAFARRMKAIAEHDAYERLPQIKCPTLVITGKDDALIAWENSRLIAESYQRCQAGSSRTCRPLFLARATRAVARRYRAIPGRLASLKFPFVPSADAAWRSISGPGP